MEKTEPFEIEKKSMQIINERLGKTKLRENEEPVLRNVILKTADFDYADTLIFGGDAVHSAISSLERGCGIITDTRVTLAGIKTNTLKRMGCSLNCYAEDDDVISEAHRRMTTPEAMGVEKAASNKNNRIFVIGEDFVSLTELYNLIQNNLITPSLIVGAAPGLIGAEDIKARLTELSIPYIIVKGAKGGSNVAAAVMTGIIAQIKD